MGCKIFYNLGELGITPAFKAGEGLSNVSQVQGHYPRNQMIVPGVGLLH
jgi:hypothetical protein